MAIDDADWWRRGPAFSKPSSRRWRPSSSSSWPLWRPSSVSAFPPSIRFRPLWPMSATGRRATIAGDFPLEIMPLVEEANAVITARAQDLIAARSRAGDLAHALKTPLAVLDVLVRRLRGNGQSDLADPIADEVGNMDRVIRRELARARANFHAASHRIPTPIYRSSSGPARRFRGSATRARSPSRSRSTVRSRCWWTRRTSWRWSETSPRMR